MGTEGGSGDAKDRGAVPSCAGRVVVAVAGAQGAARKLSVDRRVFAAQARARSGYTVTPTVLVATTDRWFPTARLVLALANAGFRVDAVCPSGHPLAKTRVVRRIYGYRGLRPLGSLAAAIEAS